MEETRSRSEAEDLVALTGFLRALARRLVGNGGSAEDLVQETCVVALKSGGARRGGLWAWLAGVMRNRARMAARTDTRRPLARLAPGRHRRCRTRRRWRNGSRRRRAS